MPVRVADSRHMGQEVSARVFSREDRQRYRQKVRSCLDVFAQMLAEDAVLIADGGGRKYAALNPIHGRGNIVRFLEGIASKFGWPKEIRRLPLNGSDAFAITEADGGLHTWSLDWNPDGKVRAIYLLRNPDKLQRVHQSLVPNAGGAPQ